MLSCNVLRFENWLKTAFQTQITTSSLHVYLSSWPSLTHWRTCNSFEKLYNLFNIILKHLHFIPRPRVLYSLLKLIMLWKILFYGYRLYRPWCVILFLHLVGDCKLECKINNYSQLYILYLHHPVNSKYSKWQLPVSMFCCTLLLQRSLKKTHPLSKKKITPRRLYNYVNK